MPQSRMLFWHKLGPCTEAEFSEYRRMIAKSMGAMLFEIINPICAKYPELKPTQLR